MDFEARDLTSVMYRLVEEMYLEGMLSDEEHKGEVLRILLYKHKYVDPDANRSQFRVFKRTLSQRSFNVSSLSLLLHEIKAKGRFELCDII